jgi:cyclopropane fatty-acyl-phospholipid synthase-like methyltransferase
MTTTNGNGSSESRLDRIERILESMVLRQDGILEQQQLLTQQLQETRAIADRTLQIAESNARSIQAWEARIEENRVEAEEDRSQLRVAILQLIEANQQNTLEHELFRRRFEAIEQSPNDPQD